MSAACDTAYDDYVQRVDDGLQCPVCKVRHKAERTTALGVPLFRCRFCDAEWFDVVTSPTQEAA